MPLTLVLVASVCIVLLIAKTTVYCTSGDNMVLLGVDGPIYGTRSVLETKRYKR